MADKRARPEFQVDLRLKMIRDTKESDPKGALMMINELKRWKAEDKSLRMMLLDERADLHLRMHNKTNAFKDAKSMIRLDLKDGRGYLRCGAIATEQNNLPLAISFLEQGLERVATSDILHVLLSLELANAQEQKQIQAISKVKDPLTVLPLEIVQILLSYLDYRQIVQMLQLSKSWKEVLQSTRPLVDTLALPVSKKFTPKVIIAALKRLKSPKNVQAPKYLPAKSARIFVEALQKNDFSTLEHLQLEGDWCTSMQLPMSKYNLRSLSLSGRCHVSMDWVCKVIRECSSLETAKFNITVWSTSSTFILDSASLQYLELDFSGLGTFGPGLTQFIEPGPFLRNLPQLRVLKCTKIFCRAWNMPMNLRHLSQLKELVVHDSFAPNLYLPGSLEEICFQGCTFRKVDPGQASFESFPPLGNLRKLELGLHDQVPKFIQQAAMITASGRLETFIWRGNKGREADCVPLIEQNWFSGLKHVEYDGVGLTDPKGKLFASCFPDMESLCISDGRRLTEDFILGLGVGLSTKLQSVKIAGRSRVSKGIVLWANDRGVEVKLGAW